MFRAALLASLVALPAFAAEPVRIGISTILSTPIADRGQSEQYGAQRALDEINQAGGVLGRPVEAFYADNACKAEVGLPATRRLIEQEHVPVVIGALCTPVTRAIEPMMQQARVPLVIATSAGQDFVDRSGRGGNDYLFKTIPSELDIARGEMRYLAGKGIRSVAVAAEAGGFPRSSAEGFIRAAGEAGIKVVADETIAEGTKEFGPLVARLREAAPGAVLLVTFGATAPFFRAYEAAAWKVPVSGRFDLGAALAAVTLQFRDGGGLADVSSVGVFSPLQDSPAVRAFVASYRAHTGLMPTQRSFFVYEAVYLVVDAIRRAGADTPEAVEAALKTTAMPSRLGGTYALDDHNHAHTPILVTGVRDGKPAVVASE